VSELTDVLQAIESLSARGQRLALATIVAVRGSTYRRPGARLLVPEEGELVGNISGGCLENDVADVAKIVMREGMARIVSFDLTADDDAVWGWGLGCNGAIELFVEPADKAAEVAGALRMALEEERPICMVTVLDSTTNARTGAKTAINTHDADIVIFLSNDVIVRGDFITPIKKIIENNPKSFIGGRVLYYDTGWNTFDFDGKRTVIPYCEGWLLACTSDAWKELGGFDPIFHPYDMEDIDISLMATSLGYDLVGLDLPYLQHISGATIAKVNPNRQAITIRNKQRFYDKWKERWPEILDEMEKAHA